MDTSPINEIVPSSSLFCAEAKQIFGELVTKFNYEIIEEVIKEFYVRLTYRNSLQTRTIVIENQTYPPDYGFGFFIYNKLSTENNIFCNVPWEKQDIKCDFLNIMKENIFNNELMVDMIKGTGWKNLKEIIYRY